jgi:hypothetical protein
MADNKMITCLWFDMGGLARRPNLRDRISRQPCRPAHDAASDFPGRKGED